LALRACTFTVGGASLEEASAGMASALAAQSASTGRNRDDECDMSVSDGREARRAASAGPRKKCRESDPSLSA
jgi:hypothetical protein